MSSLPKVILFKIAIRIQNELVLVAPVDTGRLRASINVKVTPRGLLISMVDYGIYVEFGTHKQRPNPFIRNTIQTKLQNIITEEVKRYYGKRQ